MKYLIALTTMLIVTLASAAENQAILDEFLEKNEPFASQVYCRENKGVPECRTIILYADKESSFPVDGFQISFSAPARPQAATEIFVPTSNVKDSTGEYYKFVDNTMNGTFTIAESGMQQVVFSATAFTYTIKGLPFGDLVFGDDDARVVLKNGDSIVYPIVD